MQCIVHFINGLEITVPQEAVASKDYAVTVRDHYYWIDWEQVLYVIPGPEVE